MSILRKYRYLPRNYLSCYHNQKLASHYQKNNFQNVTINLKSKIWTFLYLSILWQYLAIFSIAKIANKCPKKIQFNFNTYLLLILFIMLNNLLLLRFFPLRLPTFQSVCDKSQRPYYLHHISSIFICIFLQI